MATQFTTWNTPKSGSAGKNYFDWLRGQQGGGGSFQVGASGPTTVGGLKPGNSWDDLQTGGGQQGMSPQELDSLDRARQRLASGTYAGSTFGRTLQDRYMNPYGYDPKTRRGLEVQAEERLAGRLSNSKENARLMANARGAMDSGGLTNLLSQLEAGSARDLNSEMTNIADRDEQMRLQRELGSAGYLTNLFGLEQGKDLAAAQFEGNINWPTDGGQGGGSTPWVGQGDQNLLNGMGQIDFTKIYNLPGGRDYWMDMARRQREAYERWKASNPQP